MVMDPNKTYFFHTLIELSVFLCFCFSQCCFLVVFVVLEICIASQWEKIFHFFLMTGCLLRWILPFKTRVSICHKLASQCRSTLVRGLPRDLLLGQTPPPRYNILKSRCSSHTVNLPFPVGYSHIDDIFCLSVRKLLQFIFAFPCGILMKKKLCITGSHQPSVPWSRDRAPAEVRGWRKRTFPGD